MSIQRNLSFLAENASSTGVLAVVGGGTGVTTSTGSGSTVLSTSPTLVTPALGTPSSGVVTNLTGTASININGTVGATTPAAGSFTSLSDSGNLTFTGTSNRITGDFTNATNANRVSFQTSTPNSNTYVNFIPSGTGSRADLRLFSSSDPDNASNLIAGISVAGEARFNSSFVGTGTYLPMTFYTSGTEKLRIAADTTGTYTFGGTAPRITGDFSNATNASRALFQSSTGTFTDIGALAPSSSTQSSAWTAYLGNDPTNTSRTRMLATSVDGRFESGITGTGTYLPMTFYAGGSEAVRIGSGAASATDKGTVGIGYTALTGVGNNGLAVLGNVGIGTNSPGAKLDVTNNQAALSYLIDTSNTTNGGSSIWRMITRNIANTGTTSVEFYKPTGTGFSVLNNDTNASNFTTFNVGSSERMRIDSSGNVGIGTSSPSASAILDAQSTTKGVRMPNMTTTQKNAISSPAAGLMVFDTTLAKLCVYSGSAWQTITSV